MRLLILILSLFGLSSAFATVVPYTTRGDYIIHGQGNEYAIFSGDSVSKNLVITYWNGSSWTGTSAAYGSDFDFTSLPSWAQGDMPNALTALGVTPTDKMARVLMALAEYLPLAIEIAAGVLLFVYVYRTFGKSFFLFLLVGLVGSTPGFCNVIVHNDTSCGALVGGYNCYTWGNWTVPPGQTWEFCTVNSVTDTCTMQDYYPTSGDFYVSTGSGTPPNTPQKYRVKVVNDTALNVVGWVTSNGVAVATRTLRPGESLEYDFNYLTGQNFTANWGYDISALNSAVDSDGAVSITPTTTGQNYSLTPTHDTTNTVLVYNSSFTNNQIAATALGSAGLINWNNTDSDAAKDSTLKAGFNKLASGQQELLQGESSIVGAINNLTNWLGGSTQWTNGYNPDNIQTNGQAAWDYAQNRINLESFDSAIGYGEAVGQYGQQIAGLGSPAAFSMEFCGKTINLDPDSIFPGIMSLIKTVWTLIILVSFALYAGQLVFEVSGYCMAMPAGQSHFQPFFPFGMLNLQVKAIALLFGGAVVVLVGIVLNFLINEVLDTLGLLPTALSAMQLGGNQIALYLLNACFPVSLFFTVLGLRITLRFIATKLMATATAARGYILGT